MAGGVEEIAVCTPPKSGRVAAEILYVAKVLGIREVYRIGGVQAIAAMAFGVGMERVDKIFGPGNRYVNEAKRQVFGQVGIDGLAGPSEVFVVSDGSQPPPNWSLPTWNRSWSTGQIRRHGYAPRPPGRPCRSTGGAG